MIVFEIKTMKARIWPYYFKWISGFMDDFLNFPDEKIKQFIKLSSLLQA